MFRQVLAQPVNPSAQKRSCAFTIGTLTRYLNDPANTGMDKIDAFRIGGMCVSVILLIGIIALPFLPETKSQPLPEE